MHRQNGLAGARATQYPHRATAVSLRELALGRVQKHTPLRQWRVKSRRHSLFICDHDEPGLGLSGFNCGGEIFGVDGLVNPGFSRHQHLRDAVARGNQEQAFIRFNRRSRFAGRPILPRS